MPCVVPCELFPDGIERPAPCDNLRCPASRGVGVWLKSKRSGIRNAEHAQSYYSSILVSTYFGQGSPTALLGDWSPVYDGVDSKNVIWKPYNSGHTYVLNRPAWSLYTSELLVMKATTQHPSISLFVSWTMAWWQNKAYSDVDKMEDETKLSSTKIQRQFRVMWDRNMSS